MNNKFSITIDDEEVYYNEILKPNVRNIRTMNEYELKLFNNYKLSITYYSNLTEQEARTKFNELQNAQPMTMADIVNSHESILVDYLREYCGNITHEDNYLYDKMCNLTSFPCKKKEVILPEMIYRISALFTIYFPRAINYGYTEKKKYAMCSVVQGTTSHSPCLKYIKDHCDTIEDRDRKDFGKSICNLVEVLSDWKSTFKINLSIAIVNTLYHAQCYILNFCEPKFIDFIKKINDFNDKKKQAASKIKEKKYDDATKLNEEADIISQEFNGDIEIWEKSKRTGGSDYNAMNSRMKIIEKYCT
jgi:hypothetical protein